MVAAPGVSLHARERAYKTFWLKVLIHHLNQPATVKRLALKDIQLHIPLVITVESSHPGGCNWIVSDC